MRIPKSFTSTLGEFYVPLAKRLTDAGYSLAIPNGNGRLRYVKVNGDSGTVAYILSTRIDVRMDASKLPRLTKAQRERVYTRENPRSGLAVVLWGPTLEEIDLAIKLIDRANALR